MEVRECNTQPCPDPCKDHGHPCYSTAVSCTKITDTVFRCGECPRGMSGDGIRCTAVNEVRPMFPFVHVCRSWHTSQHILYMC